MNPARHPWFALAFIYIGHGVPIGRLIVVAAIFVLSVLVLHPQKVRDFITAPVALELIADRTSVIADGGSEVQLTIRASRPISPGDTSIRLSGGKEKSNSPSAPGAPLKMPHVL